MKISIVIPIYNVAPFVADCIRSVIRQTWQGQLECIFVDDCGTDNSMEIVRSVVQDYQGPIDFKTVRHEQNRGLSVARNTGIAAASGDYIYFLDSDDEITPDCMAVLASPIEQERYDVIVGDYRIVGSGMPKIPLMLSEGQILRDQEVLHAYRQKDWYMMSVNKLYRKALLDQYDLRFREGIIHEDELWSFQIACKAQTLACVKKETYIYKLREGSITVREFAPRRAESMNIILKEMCEFAQAHGLTGNRDVHNIIQNFRIDCLNKVRVGAPEMLHDFYHDQRRMMTTSWINCCRINGGDLKKQIRDLHMVLPLPVAYPYLGLLLRYFEKKSCS
ncbi:MAG: glycosyltransferase family 2 protein [Prevotella sp.]|nr:glycosyltransferase family 2 protein [Prevotella sp.]